MALWDNLLKASIVLFIVVMFAIWNDILPMKPKVPVIEKTWFGPGKPLNESDRIKPFLIYYKHQVNQFNKSYYYLEFSLLVSEFSWIECFSSEAWFRSFISIIEP